MKHRIYITLLGIFFCSLAFGQSENNTETSLNKELVATLDTIHQTDQKYRVQAREIKKKYGWNSDENKEIWKIINKTDSINLIKVKKIINEFGWLGEDIVGKQGNSTLFLVIQHSNLETQLVYLPIMKDAAIKGNAERSSLALLEDRVALGLGEKQIYGSQLEMDFETKKYIVSPMINPENVNKRRSEVGLGTIEEYISFWGLTWDLKKYIERNNKIDAEKQNN